MPQVEYTRTDLVLTCRLREGEMEVDAAFTGFRGTLAIANPADIPEADVRPALGGAIEAWASAARQAERETHITRVLLRVEGRDEAGEPWERMVPALVDGFHPPAYAIVRDTPVPPRASLHPWTLPLRIVHEDADASGLVRESVGRTFGSFVGPQAETAVRVLELTPKEMLGWAPAKKWPSAEVIHVSSLPLLLWPDRPVDAGTVSATLLWLQRFTDVAQSRLLIIETASLADESDARELATRLAACGGPAVLVLGEPTPDAIVGLYDFLIHDRPLDWIARELQGRGGWYQPPVAGVTLVAGAGREEAVRVSTPALQLIELADWLESGDKSTEGDLLNTVLKAKWPFRFDPTADGSIIGPIKEPDGRMIGEAIADASDVRSTLGRVRERWQDLRFEDHESGGLMPYAAELAGMRTRVLGSPEPRVRISGRDPVRVIAREPDETLETGWGLPIPPELVPSRARELMAEPPPEEPAARWVVPSLADADGSGPITQRGARLTLGRTYHLGIRIGEKDEQIRVVGAEVLLDEVLKLRPEDQGAWIEVGVTGIGFDVLGEPVQELWMPRGAGSDTMLFAVVPRDETVAVLRYTLYHRGSAVQSYRLAAATVKDGARPARNARKALARALEMTPDDVGGDGWLARMEFSLVADPAAIETRPERALSIVANDVNGKPVVTVKGGDSFDVWFPGDVSQPVKDLRAMLDRVATEKTAQGAAYNFGRSDPARPNGGDEATLRQALVELARLGAALYQQLFAADSRRKMAALLEGREDATIQVAHVLLEKVLPWSLLYDRPFKPNAQVDAQGNPLAVDACLAALPGPDGAPSPVRCGQGPCLLAQGDLRYTRDTVVCPRHFWGFRHVVEVPPQQVPPGGEAVPQVDVVSSGNPASLVCGFNESLVLAKSHRAQLEALGEVASGRAKWADPQREFAGEFLVHRLDAADVDLIYLYCHARGGAADPTVVPPCLEFVGQQGPARVGATDLESDVEWEHHPLVILNGCGTVGFSPDALSPFLPVLVRDRGAAGVLGTEISVWEQLAGEFAEHFLGAFLGGRTAGQALLEARRKLLAQHNPLGLAYTLYASADLHFAQ